ncbi:MAG: uroporphyrinogen decarboxylase family protein [Candidatus Hodarchaeota archaeon]
MESFDRVMAALKNERNELDRYPVMNSVATYTQDFMVKYDATWPEAHFDADKMVRLAAAAYEECGLDNASVPFDMLVEPEIFGTPIDYHEGKILWPSVTDYLFHRFEDVSLPDDIAHAGRVPVVVEAMKKLKEKYEGVLPINAYIDPPFTAISSYVVDSIEFLINMKKAPEVDHEWMKGSVPFYKELCKIYEEAGADLITFHEMGASADNISPKYFREFILPYNQEIVKDIKVPVIMNVCGLAAGIVGAMVETGATAVAIDERTKITGAIEERDAVNPNIPIMGNLPAQTILWKGPVEKIQQAVQMVINTGIDIVAPGCDFWLQTPTEHVCAFVDAVKEFGKLK